MGDIASTYRQLGRHEDALAMQERVLELSHRVLLEDHPSFGETHVCSDTRSFFFYCERTYF